MLGHWKMWALPCGDPSRFVLFYAWIPFSPLTLANVRPTFVTFDSNAILCSRFRRTQLFISWLPSLPEIVQYAISKEKSPQYGLLVVSNPSFCFALFRSLSRTLARDLGSGMTSASVTTHQELPRSPALGQYTMSKSWRVAALSLRVYQPTL